MSNKAGKGSCFERELCKQLSLWWTKGLGLVPRDDIFWRSSQSGGRATQRAKSGKTTFGSYGDIAFVDPIGAPLLKLFTIELKRGSTYGVPSDLMETSQTKAVRAFEGCLNQTIRSHEQSGSEGWLLITRRDHRVAMVYVDAAVVKRLTPPKLFAPPCIRYSLVINQPDTSALRRVRFVSWKLDDFLKRVTPLEIVKLIENLKK